MSKIANIKNATTIFEQNGVVGKQLLLQDILEYVSLTFEPGAETQAHIQNILMTFYIANGKGTVIIDETSHELTKGNLIEIPAGKSRQWKNTGNETLELFGVKSIK